MRISAAEETATQAFEEVGNMRDEIADLRERLQKVCLPLNFLTSSLLHMTLNGCWYTVQSVVSLCGEHCNTYVMAQLQMLGIRALPLVMVLRSVECFREELTLPGPPRSCCCKSWVDGAPCL